MAADQPGGEIPRPMLERLARAIHEAYVADRLAEHRLLGTEPALRSWKDLPEHLKEANRAQASGYAGLLASIGYAVVPAGEAGDARAEPADFRPDELERMARAEHDRWLRHKLSQGYHYGAQRVEDPADRRHPSILPWEDLPEEVRDLDRQPLRRMRATLSLADLRAVPIRTARTRPA